MLVNVGLCLPDRIELPDRVRNEILILAERVIDALGVYSEKPAEEPAEPGKKPQPESP